MRRIGHKAPVLVVNDALAALVAGAGDQGPGIVLIAGTGSICYGRNEAGQAARAGGWGYLLGDEGSGWWIGRRTLSAVMRAGDGRGPATLLTERVLAHLELDETSDLIHEVYYRDTRRRAVAGLSGVVQRAADDGDVVARQILAGVGRRTGAGGALGRHAARDARPAVSAGAVRQPVPRAADAAVRRAGAAGRGAPRSQPKVLDVEPAIGAVRLALAEARGGARIPQYI